MTREWIVRISTKSLLLHVLYARGVCPAPAVEALRAFQEKSYAKVNPLERKFVKFGASLQQLLNEWTILSSMVEIQKVLVTWGPSWSRQKELYVLDFFGVGNDGDGNMPEPSLGHEHALSRRLVRALLQGLSNQVDTEKCFAHPSREGSSYQVHVSFWVTRKIAHELFQKSKENGSLWQKLSKPLILRQEYSIARHVSKRTQPHIVTTKVSSTADTDEVEWNEEAGIWISLPTAIKGFRL